MELIAHRGCADQFPENTVLAIERASDRLRSVEFDVRRCGSGELVVFHDDTVDRVTDGEGRVADLELSRLRTLDVLGSDERIPLLSEALAAVPAAGRAQVELKQTGIAADALAAVAAADVPVRLTSFLPESLEEVRERDPDARLGYLFDGDADEALETALSLDCEAIHPRASQCLETDVVERAHEADLLVVAWGVERKATLPELRAAGVDAATSDWSDVTGFAAEPAATNGPSVPTSGTASVRSKTPPERPRRG